MKFSSSKFDWTIGILILLSALSLMAVGEFERGIVMIGAWFSGLLCGCPDVHAGGK